MAYRIAPFSITLSGLHVIHLLQTFSNAIFRTIMCTYEAAEGYLKWKGNNGGGPCLLWGPDAKPRDRVWLICLYRS